MNTYLGRWVKGKDKFIVGGVSIAESAIELLEKIGYRDDDSPSETLLYLGWTYIPPSPNDLGHLVNNKRHFRITGNTRH